jgi:tRNA-2-methylthio-N6-dimethylallyladenosine synthase
MNVHESEKLAGILQEYGFCRADGAESADIIVFNTCCIRESAETRVLGNLGRVKSLKDGNPSLIIAVCGCMTQNPGAAERLKKRCPFVDIIFGTHNLHKLGDYLSDLESKKTRVEIWDGENGSVVEDVPIARAEGVNAWVNIMYGCDNFCSYCVVPYVRGRERSRDMSVIVAEVKELVSGGYKEITLLGQNVNSYGRDGNDKGTNFAALLEKLSALDGKFRIRFMTSHPKDLDENVIKTVAASDKVSDFIHLPAQSGSDRILGLMNRKYTAKEYLTKIETIKKYIPGAGLSTDIMVGFPSETEDDFAKTLGLVREARYNNAFTFIYSRRSGTAADKMDGQIPYEVKKERIMRLIDLQAEIGSALASECVGKTYEMLCDEYDPGQKTGRGKSDCGKTITFGTDADRRGGFVRVKVTGAKNTNLYAEACEE